MFPDILESAEWARVQTNNRRHQECRRRVKKAKAGDFL
jgi:hypothetical protein